MILKKILACSSIQSTNKENITPVALLRNKTFKVGKYELNTHTIKTIIQFLKSRRENILTNTFSIQIGDSSYITNKNSNTILYQRKTEANKETQVWQFNAETNRLILSTNTGKSFYSIHLTQKSKGTQFTISNPDFLQRKPFNAVTIKV